MQNQFTTPEPSVFTTPILAPEPGTEDAAVTSDTLSEQNLAAQQARVQAVDALLDATQRKIRRRKRRFWGAAAVVEGTIFLVLMPLCFTARSTNAPLSVMVVCLVVALAALIVMLSTMHTRDEFDLEELMRIGGVRAIAPLLDSHSSGRTPGSRTLIYAPLTELLPRLRATDANLLSARHRRILNNLLRTETWPTWWGPKPMEASFGLAILKAYEQAGDAKSIPVVSKLAHMKARTPRQRAIQQAAAQCLPLLQSHTVPLDQNQTLLRAASQSSAATAILLRPAQDAAPAPAGELLRAADELGAEVRADA